MDPVAAFSLAGTIVTFVDFGVKLAKLTWAIYHGEEDASGKGNELANLVQTVEKALITDEQNPTIAITTTTTQSSEATLGQLRSESIAISRDLVRRLHGAGLISVANSGRRAALKTALNNIFKKDELLEIQNKLAELQSQFSLQLLFTLRHFAAETLASQQAILRELQLSNVDRDSLTTNMQILLKHVTSNQYDEAILNKIVSRQEHGISQQPTKIVVTDNIREDFVSHMMGFIAYSGMHNREEDVVETYETTFDWALQHDPQGTRKWADFPTWLENNEPVYWISGKAGSGKSTLMKYLSATASESPTADTAKIPRCQQFLKKWARDRDVVIAPFYFWAANPGAMQTSKNALLRTLLYRILAVKPQLVPQLLPAAWESYTMLGTFSPSMIPNSEVMLQKTLLHSVDLLLTGGSSICFFIDGLDEFNDSPEVLIDLVKQLTKQEAYVKLCLASRPWVEFEDAFSCHPHLRLEDLNHDDISLFVNKKFSEHPEFGKLQKREEQFAGELIAEIISKGQGVFLWVSLVVASLLSGMAYGDRVVDLRRRLDDLPPQLDALYKRILTSLDGFYNEHRAQIIQLMEAAYDALTLEVFLHADDGNVESLKALSRKSESYFSTDCFIEREDLARRRLNSRWKGLIEVTRSTDHSDACVQYLHKTVRDFVRSDVMIDFVHKAQTPEYDPHLQLAIGYAADLIEYSHFIDDQWDYRLVEWARSCVKHLKAVKTCNQDMTVKVLDQISTQAITIYSPSIEDYKELNKLWTLALALEEGLWKYCSTAIPALSGHQSSIMLPHFVGCVFENHDDPYEPPDAFVRALLESCSTLTAAWIHLITKLTDQFKLLAPLDITTDEILSCNLRIRMNLVRLFVEYGEEPNDFSTRFFSGRATPMPKEWTKFCQELQSIKPIRKPEQKKKKGFFKALPLLGRSRR